MTALTRRVLLTGAVAAPVVMAAGRAEAAALAGDAAALTRALRLEQALALAYHVAGGDESAELKEIAGRFAPHERAHVGAIATSLEALGAPKLAPLKDVSEVDALARDLGIAPVLSRATAPHERLAFLLALEEHLVAVWTQEHRTLAEPRLLRLATTILGCQAQHLVVLRQALGRDPLGRALETGRR